MDDGRTEEDEEVSAVASMTTAKHLPLDSTSHYVTFATFWILAHELIAIDSPLLARPCRARARIIT